MRELKARGAVRPTHLWLVGGILAILFAAACIGLLFGTLGANIHWTGWNHPAGEEANTLRFLIESSPNNLDLRQGTDAQSEHVGSLIYDALAPAFRTVRIAKDPDCPCCSKV